MKYKCMVCDEKGEKSIDTNSDDYIKVVSSYVHSDCYRVKLTTRRQNRLTESDAIVEIQRIKEIMDAEGNLAQLKDDFFRMLMDYYDINLPSYFYQKIAEIVNGKRKGLKDSISYSELYEMYSNEKMLRKLEKIAFKKNMNDMGSRLFWDLGVMVNEYDKYKKSKSKKLHEDDTVKKLIEETERMKHIITRKDVENNEEKEDESVDLGDLII